ncbi:MAG: serine/threonine-protein kinase [Planctomycetota bacterium]|nr:serine/threonine protein kinase [Planctomycetota bacterium]MCB9826365.1 serine/threonine protein kinase [Planctomycetota bacterium]MCB9901161.1 serine/threonine protein kinase [Planctomycetota bacterium]
MSDSHEEPGERREPAVPDDAKSGETVLPRLEAAGGFEARVHLRGATADADSDASVPAPTGASGPKYRIEGELGRGGVGVVLRGSDADLGREVAIKVLRDEHLASPDVLKRFVEEAQIGGQLQHPGVVPVYELGMRDGRPFFAMKLIHGRSLADLLAARAAPGEERRRFLGIFEAVCQTMAYAHARGVIHRDLKPENVMVGAFGEVQVVDWGMSKVLGSRRGTADEAAAPDTAPTLRPLATVRSESVEGQTVLGSMMGTPGYMPPEQALGNIHVIDERSDVYALGAILCEILVGEPPFVGAPIERVRGALTGDLSSVDARLATSSTDPELRTLVLDCLQKDQTARPASARVVADRIRSFLEAAEERAQRAQIEAAQARANEAEAKASEAKAEVRAAEARAEGERERAAAEQAELRAEGERRRRRAAAILAVVLLVGMAGTAWGLVSAMRARAAEQERAEAEHRERVRATRAEADANTQRGLAEANEAKAKDQLALATAIDEFLRNDLLGQASSQAQADRGFEQDPDLTVREALHRAAQGVGSKFADRPREEAAIRHTLGETYRQLGDAESAIQHLERALALRVEVLGPWHEDTIFTRDELAHSLLELGRFEDAARELERIRDAQREAHGENSSAYESAVHNLSAAYLRTGQTQEAIEQLEWIVERRGGVDAIDDDEQDLLTLQQLARAYRSARRFAESLPLSEKVARGLERTLGPEHPGTLQALNGLGLAYSSLNRSSEAVPILERVAAGYARNLGPDHPDALIARQNLARTYVDVGRAKEAAEILEQVRGPLTELLGPDHMALLAASHSLAKAWIAVGRTAEGIELAEEVLRRRTEVLGADHPETLRSLAQLGKAYRATSDLAKAADVLKQLVSGARKRFGDEAEFTISAAFALATTYQAQGDVEQAATVVDEWLPRGLALSGRDAATRLRCAEVAAEIWLKAGQNEKAPRALDVLLIDVEVQAGPRSLELATRLAALSEKLLQAEAFAAAEPRLRKVLSIRRELDPEGWRTFEAESLLGAALTGQAKFDDAAPLLVSGYRGMKAREDRIPADESGRVADALQRIVKHYLARDRGDEAEAWRSQGAR